MTHAAAAATPPNVSASPSAPAFYVIDDLSADRHVAQSAIEIAGHSARGFSGGAQLLDALSGLAPGVFLVDLMMPDVDGAAVLDAVTRRDAGDVVLMMSAHADIAAAVGAIRRGAHDFLLKPLDMTEATETLARAVSLFTSRQEAERIEASVRDIVTSITPKEMLVLRHLLAGKRNKTIAFELGVSERTIEVHRARLIKRSNSGTFAGLIAFAVRAGIAPAED
ncbi:MAG: response regulator [Pseudomonadota bacterium]